MILLNKGSELVGEKSNGAKGRGDSLVGSLVFCFYSDFFWVHFSNFVEHGHPCSLMLCTAFLHFKFIAW